MINEWLQALSEVLFQNVWIGLLVSLLAGFLSSFTPCSLTSVPLIIGYVGGYTKDKKKALLYTIAFCVGQTIVFVVMGIIVAFVGRLFFGIQKYWYIILGVLMVLMALQTWEVIQIFPRKQRYGAVKYKGILGGFIMGILGAVFASPCSTPMLIAITAIVSSSQTIVMGVIMLLLYSIGHSVLVVIAGTSLGFVNEVIHSTRFAKVSKIIKIATGIIFFAISLYLFFLAFA